MLERKRRFGSGQAVRLRVAELRHCEVIQYSVPERRLSHRRASAYVRAIHATVPEPGATARYTAVRTEPRVRAYMCVGVSV